MQPNLHAMTMDQQVALTEENVRRAREAGEDEDTIRRAFPAATQRPIREAMERTLDNLRVKPMGPQFSDADKNSMAWLGSILRGDTPHPDDSAKTRSNRLPDPVKEAGDLYSEEFRQTSVGDLVDPEDVEGSLSQVVASSTNREANIKGGVKEALRLASTPEQRMLQYAEAAHMEQRSIRAQWQHRIDVLEAAKFKMLDHNRPEYGAAVNDGVAAIFNADLFPNFSIKDAEGNVLMDSSIPGLSKFKEMFSPHAAELLAEFTPRVFYDLKDKTEAMIAVGLLPDNTWSRVFGYALAAGSTNQQAIEHLMTLTPEEQGEALVKLGGLFMESGPEELRSNFNGWLWMDDLIPDELIYENDPDSWVRTAMLNVIGWLGVVELIPVIGYGAAAVRGTIRIMSKATPPVRMLLMQNPVRYAAAMRRAFNEMPDSAVMRMFNINKLDIVETQMPHPGHLGDSIANVPSNIADPHEAARVVGAAEAAINSSRSLNAAAFNSGEQARIVDNIASELEAAHAGRIRPNMSSIRVRDDMSGVEMDVMIGATDSTGFKSLDEAIAYGQTELGFGHGMEYFKAMPNGVVNKVRPHVVKDPATGIWSASVKEPGEYYIRAKYQHTYMPEDAHLFDGNPPVVGTWMGRMMGSLNTPSAFLQSNIVSKFTRAVMGEQSLTHQLDAIIAPLYKQLNDAQRLVVNDTMIWAEDFGKQFGRLPTPDELKNQFPRLSSQELQGFYTARYFQDTLWAIQNARLHNNWLGRGFRTATKTGTRTAYHGEPVTSGSLKQQNITRFLDPETGHTRIVTADELDAFFADGGSVLRLDMAVSGSKGNAHKHVMIDPKAGWHHGKLKKHVLEYIPGYNTRIYADAHFVQRVKRNAHVDGKLEELVSTARTASTRAEAEAWRRRMIDGVGRRLMKGNWDKTWDISRKEKELVDRGYELRIARDSRLSDADRVQVDLSKMQTEGRLFFDDRLNKPLKNTDNVTADVVDPINAMQRVARMTSRQVATEDLVASQKTRFFDQYGDLGISTRRASSEIDADLTDMINQGDKVQSSRAAAARAEWRYIRFIEGSMVQGNTAFRRAAIASAEWLDHAVGAKIGARGVTRTISRKAHNISAVAAAKQLAFLHFMTAKPLRQLMLQGAQHFALQALDPAYAGKWQMDTWSLLSAMKRLARTREGDLLYVLKRDSAGRMMGRTEDEMRVLLEEFEKAGISQQVNIHSYAGGNPKSGSTTYKNRAAQLAQGAVQTTAKPLHIARTMGFDLGETYNVTASYLMALRLHMKTRGLKKFTEMDTEDWAEVANRGSHFALSMHKGNPAAWQYGFLSLPMQFLQFTHKWTMMSLNAIGMRKSGFGNLQFTTRESQKIILAQMLYWGGAGVGLKEGFRTIIDSREELDDLSVEQRELLLSGIVDWGINELFRRLTGDPDLKFAFDEVFAPGMGMDHTVETLIEMASEPTMLHEAVLGPSGEVLSRVGEAVRLGAALTGKSFEHWDFTQRAAGVIEAAAGGFLGSYSDFLRVRLAARMGQWTNAAGVPLGYEAKWEELVIKGALGVNPQKLLDYYRGQGEAYDLSASLKSDAKTHALTIARVVRQWGEGDLEKEEALAMFNNINVVYQEYKDAGYEELFYDAYLQEFKKLRTAEGDSLLKWMTEKVLRGYTGDPIKDMLRSRAITPEQAERLQLWFDKAVQEQDENHQKRVDQLEGEREHVRRLTQ